MKSSILKNVFIYVCCFLNAAQWGFLYFRSVVACWLTLIPTKLKMSCLTVKPVWFKVRTFVSVTYLCHLRVQSGLIRRANSKSSERNVLCNLKKKGARGRVIKGPVQLITAKTEVYFQLQVLCSQQWKRRNWILPVSSDVKHLSYH